jgi:predicted dehydrogenase
MNAVRLGIIGVGSMGASHARNASQVRDMKLCAVCDNHAEKADRLAKELGCLAFHDATALIKSGSVDAVLIATPHYDHTTIGIAAFEQGLHVLVEKPISVHKADCERLIAAADKHPDRTFAAMFMMRTMPTYRKIRDLVKGGELGEIRRVNWICTNWFRTEAYYASGGWRATWKGEGGGVLLNQAPHNLDLFQWICGMPSRVHGFCRLGKWHDIEVEDDVTTFLEYPNGATGVFITTTGEAPGTNRLEICGEQGKLVLEGGKLHYSRNVQKMSEFCRTTKEMFAQPEAWEIEIPVTGTGGMHVEVIQNFVDNILKGTPLIANAREGIHSVELANSILYSSLTQQPVDLPLNGAAFEKALQKMIAESRFVKKTATGATSDMNASFNLK